MAERKISKTGESIPGAIYEEIDDVSLRTQLRVGELVQVAASNNGIGNLMSESERSDDICGCIKGLVMNRLKLHDQNTILTVLKNAKTLARQILPDREEERSLVLKELDLQIETVCHTRSVLPDLPSRN